MKDYIPKITVLMPVYNCELYINEAIDSILNQTFTDFEFLIIDDASTDETVAIIETYKDSRIILLQKPENTGYINSLNYGIKLAKGKYIARMDGDDFSHLQRFEKQVAFLEANEKVILCSGWYSLMDSGIIRKLPESHETIKLAFLRGNCMAHPLVMIRKEVLDKLDVVYDVSKEPSEDYDLFVRLAFLGELHNLQEVLLDYRIHGSQVSSKIPKKRVINDLNIKTNLFNSLEFSFSQEEQLVFDKILNNGERIEFKDFPVFKNVQRKLLSSNTKQFFEPVGFIQEILHLDKIVIKSCFLKKKQFSSKTYFDYLKIKNKTSYKLDLKDEIKLIFKSLIYFKSK
jgi:glycosyltransferase involved in cell wall biosynthesis